MTQKKIICVLILLLAVSVSASDKACVNCHTTGKKQATIVDVKTLESSVHSKLYCNECHTKIKPAQDHKGERFVDCGTCHKEEADMYAGSPHMEGRSVDHTNLPTCTTCHGGHDILQVKDPKAKTNHRNSVTLCTSCHEDEGIQQQSDVLPEPQMIIAYENSVHGYELLVKGNDDAPACVDCHGSHSALPSDRPESPVQKSLIAETCGECHPDISKLYKTSIHGVALAGGVLESPTCTDCHGEHNIKAHLDPESKVFSINIPKTCSACHTSEKVVGKFGLKADRIETFKESFHGIAVELGESKAANCASCHGVHDIFTQDNPKSLIHKDNIQKTCGQCHEDLPEDFAKGMVHTSAKDRESGGKFFVRQFYIFFISILVIGFIIYRILEYKRRIKRVE